MPSRRSSMCTLSCAHRTATITASISCACTTSRPRTTGTNKRPAPQEILRPPRGRSSRVAYGQHTECVQFARLVADRDIFAGRKGVCAEPVAGLVVIFGRIVVIENPLRMLRTAGLVQQMSNLFLAAPEPA